MQKQQKEREQVKTRRQMTEDRIAENIQKFNDPSGISNSLFDMHLLGTQAATNQSQFTNYGEENANS